jgi:predicted house-cleaning noncanonical NTP pyrophosphatase (MazG superfamily)
VSEKLVRDRIADFVFRERGEILNTRVALEEELLPFIRQKIVEEANEVFLATTKEELAEELADLLEVMKTLATKEGVVDLLFEKQSSKYLEKGGFDKGIILKK